MKTKFLLLIIGLFTGITFNAHTNRELPADILKTNIKTTIAQECSKWDYSSLTEKNSKATIAFRVSENGIVVEAISTNDSQFKNLIENNLPKIKINQPAGEKEEIFYINLSHKTI